MKIYIFILILFLPAVQKLFAQHAATLAPLNPDFIQYIEKLNTGNATTPAKDEFGTGAMPPPGLVNFDAYFEKNKLKTTDFAPVYDMRTMGLVTPVKGQTLNACWAYATMASVESQWLKSGLGAWDLSENNLKYCHGFDASRNEYGNHWMSTAYFARRSGPLAEADDPNAASSSCPSGKIPVGYITDARYLPNDRNTIKQAIMDHGAIYTMMYANWSSNYFTTANNTYYFDGSAEVNHAVDLVGWDDNKLTAGGTGAWICRNSYGPGWGESGYFYIAYQNHSFLDYNAYWPTCEDYKAEDYVYGYDELGNYGAFGYDMNVGYMLVKFVSPALQKVTRVSTYAMASNENIEIDVFTDFDPGQNKLSGLVSHTGGITCTLPGYYTCDLSTPVSVEPGEDFYIRIRYQTPGIDHQIPVEFMIPGYSYPAIESNVAWISSNGKDGSWYLIGNTNNDYNSYYKADPCVKIHAEPRVFWTGNQSTDWNIPGNWSNAVVPDGNRDIEIPDVANDPVVNQPVTNPAVCRNLLIKNGAKLTIANEKALTINGSLTNQAGNTGLVIETGASLITLGSISGTATVRQAITGSKWHLISAPVSDAVSGTFTGKYLQKHTESSNAYAYITSVSEPLVVLKGYALWSPGDYIAGYTGQLNTGSNSIVLSRSTDDLFNRGWNLVGNPYPSAIDWDAATGWTKQNVNSTIYFLNNGAWATYISGTESVEGIGANGGTRYIAANQGFFVSVGDVGDATLAMDNRVRVHNTVPFLKNTETGRFVRLKISGNGYSDEAVVRFIPDATAEFDRKYDAPKLFGSVNESPQVYTVGSMPLTINSLPSGTSDVTMGIRGRTNGNYTLTAGETGNIDEVILEDLKTGVFTELSRTPYTFTLATGENEQRFVLHFNSLTDIKLNNSDALTADVFSYNHVVHVTLKDQIRGDIFIYNTKGQVVATRTSVTGKTDIDLRENGIYILKLIASGNTLVREIMIY